MGFADADEGERGVEVRGVLPLDTIFTPPEAALVRRVQAFADDAAGPYRKDLKRALELSPEESPVLNYLGYTWVDQSQNLKTAMDYIRKAVKLAAKYAKDPQSTARMIRAPSDPQCESWTDHCDESKGRLRGTFATSASLRVHCASRL